MNLSIVILTWNSSKHIDNCLSSIFNSIENNSGQFEIFVIDNGSTDNSRNIVENYQKKYPDIVKTIFLDSNAGTTYSRNLALKQVSGKYVAVIDSDVIVSPGIFERLIRKLSASEDIGLIAPKLIYGNGHYQKSTDFFPTLSSKAYRYFFLKNIEKAEGQVGQSEGFVDYAISAFWLFRKSLLSDVGFLDEKIFYAPEDVDYCLRIWQEGYGVYYFPEVEAIHNAQEISRGFRINKGTFEHLKGLGYFFKKHKFFLKKPHFKK
jgi:GT2 family glycosyltransferase